MAQPILIGLIGAIGMLAAAIITLIGVLLKTFTDFKLGKRTAGVAEQTADDNRAKELAAENKGLREEIKLLRKEAWETEQDQRHQITELENKVSSYDIQLNIALRAQERAEGGLVTAERTIQAICPPSENCPPESSPPEQRQEQP